MTYATSTWLFTRSMGFIYFFAFTSLALEARGLWGARGVLPLAEYFAGFAGGDTWWPPVPSLFYYVRGDGWIVGLAAAGAASGLLASIGVAEGVMLALCWLLYLSFVMVGQEFLSFQWDVLLLEVGLVALFSAWWTVPFGLFYAAEPPWWVRFGLIGILFKLMFLSGVVKLLGGDDSWRDFTALKYHYWTQPLPNPLSLFAHAAPVWSHRVGTAATLLIELVLPFAVFWPAARPVAGLGFIALSIFIASTGNYTFFNGLTAALALWLIPDAWWGGLLASLRTDLTPVTSRSFATLCSAAVMTILLGTDVYWCTRPWLPRPVIRALAPLINVLQSFHLSSSYGLFATMTKSRPEIVIEGSVDGEKWLEYEFKYKPGPLHRRPPVIAPLQPRLDWQMWFAALGTFRQNPFVGALMVRLFEGSPEVLRFFVTNPFPTEPPRFLRARLYAYEFARPGEWWAENRWWSRALIGDYSPTFRR